MSIEQLIPLRDITEYSFLNSPFIILLLCEMEILAFFGKRQ